LVAARCAMSATKCAMHSSMERATGIEPVCAGLEGQLYTIDHPRGAWCIGVAASLHRLRDSGLRPAGFHSSVVPVA